MLKIFIFILVIASSFSTSPVSNNPGAKIRHLRTNPEENSNKNHHLRKRSTQIENLVPTTNYQSLDPEWGDMWYLNGEDGVDMNVKKVWASGITGKGVVVSVVADGVETMHVDLADNYDPEASYDVIDDDPDPNPVDFSVDYDGTRCAGEISGVADNEFCGVGVAYNSKIGGIRLLDLNVTDEKEGKALAYNIQHVDIYMSSWGPDDNGRVLEGPGIMATKALTNSIKNGRGGKGSIHVWAAGIGGFNDDCNCDGYVNSIYTIAISSVTSNHTKPWYGEKCSAILAATFNSVSGSGSIVTTDIFSQCTHKHKGSTAPFAAGICALALEANPNLTWRDMQHLIVRSSRPLDLEANWVTNGVGRKVSNEFGYGLMNAWGMVELARNWTTVNPARSCEVSVKNIRENIDAQSKLMVEFEVKDNCNNVNILEHVQAKITLKAGKRGDIQIKLRSPAGTWSTLLNYRKLDLSKNGFADWPFMTVHFWDESPLGTWTLEITNNWTRSAQLKNVTLVVHGTSKVIDMESQKVSTPPLVVPKMKQRVTWSSIPVFVPKEKMTPKVPMIVTERVYTDPLEDAFSWVGVVAPIFKFLKLNIVYIFFIAALLFFICTRLNNQYRDQQQQNRRKNFDSWSLNSKFTALDVPKEKNGGSLLKAFN